MKTSLRTLTWKGLLTETEFSGAEKALSVVGVQMDARANARRNIMPAIHPPLTLLWTILNPSQFLLHSTLAFGRKQYADWRLNGRIQLWLFCSFCWIEADYTGVSSQWPPLEYLQSYFGIDPHSQGSAATAHPKRFLTANHVICAPLVVLGQKIISIKDNIKQALSFLLTFVACNYVNNFGLAWFGR